jgi:hypothetical protein
MVEWTRTSASGLAITRFFFLFCVRETSVTVLKSRWPTASLRGSYHYDGKIYGTEGVDIWDKGNRIKKREPLSLHDEFTNGKRDGDFLALRLKTTCHILF